MIEKYIYIFDAIIFITGLCSFFVNLKRDKSMLNSVVSILIGVFGALIAHVIYVIADGKWLSGKLVVIIYVIMEFIEILLLFKKKNWKTHIISIFTTILIVISILYANQIDAQSIFDYSLDNQNNTAVINGFSKENKESDIEIPRYIVKGLRFYKVTEIGEEAFYKCDYLHYVKLPDSIKIIKNYAFAESGLYDINIPNDIEIIWARAFYKTAGLSKDEVKISDNVKIYDDLISHVDTKNYSQVFPYLSYLNTAFKNERYLVDRKKSFSSREIWKHSIHGAWIY